jgi:hypothetical protein
MDPAQSKQRSLRDTLLGVAAIVFSCSQALAVVGSILLLADMLKNLVARGLITAQSFDVAGDLLRVAGFALAAAAFLGRPPDRAGKLRAGLILVAGGYSAWCFSDVARTIRYAKTHAGKAYVASHAILGVSDLLVAVAAATAATAFAGALHAAAGVRAQRDKRLGWSSIFLAAGISFAMISSVLFLKAFPGLGATSGFTAGFGVAAAGEAVGIVGPVIAAVAFLNSAQRQEQGGASRLRDREGILATAAAFLAIGLAISALGSIESASAGSINGFDNPSLTAAWLDVSRQLGWAAGIGVTCVGFLLSRTMLAGQLCREHR